MEAKIKNSTHKKLITVGQLPERTLAVIEEGCDPYKGSVVFKLSEGTLISLDGKYWNSVPSFLVRVLSPDEIVEVHN